MNKKALTAIFNLAAVLLAIFLVGKAIKGRQQTRYSGDCPDLPLSAIQKMEIDEVILVQGKDNTALRKEEETWKIANADDQEANADKINQFLYNLANSQCLNLASANPKNHDRFQITPEEGLLVTLNKQGAEIVSFYLGKSGQPLNTTYIRLAGKDQVYTIQSRVKSGITADKEDWIKNE